MTPRFRVWDGEEMHEPRHAYVIDDHGGVGKLTLWDIEPVDAEVMFSTSLTDSDGTEIYEGDVLQVRGNYWEDICPDPVAPPTFEVIYDENGFWRLGGDPLNTTPLGRELEEQPFILVGNRYENPALLEEKA